MTSRKVQLLITTTQLSNQQLQRIQNVSDQIELIHLPDLDRAAIGRALRQHPAVEVLFTTSLPDPWQPGGCLRWVQTSSAGVDTELDNPLWNNSDIPVCTASGIHGPPISQWVTAMVLHHALRLDESLRFKQTRDWNSRFSLEGTVLIGKVMGLVGFGSIGRECARLARALGMRVLAFRRSATQRSASKAAPERERFVPARVAQRAGAIEQIEQVQQVDLDRVLRESDYLVVSMPLTAATQGLIGRRELQEMKPTAFVINVGRGAVIDESALVDALEAGGLGGAALDVFATEPPPRDSRLFTAPKLLMSPHVSGNFVGYFDGVIEVLCANLQRYLDGRPLLNVASREEGY